jgi:hypothetical protein
VLHLLQFTEVGIPLLAALALEINTGVILLIIVCLVLHEATAMWDVRLANRTREVMPIEQHIHSVLEMLPLTAVLMVVALNWSAFLGLLGMSYADFAPRLSHARTDGANARAFKNSSFFMQGCRQYVAYDRVT